MKVNKFIENPHHGPAGELLGVSTYAVLAGKKRPVKVSERSYCGDFVFEGDSLAYVNFPGGYFDGEGKPHYRHPDFQGNITMVTDSDGKIEQHTGYYPYGEPWHEPSGQPYLYGGKERMRDGALNDYDFSARRLNSALCLWSTPDPMAIDYTPTNPYVYCAGNPIRYTDPSGCVITGNVDLIDDYKANLDLMEAAAKKANIQGLIDFCNDQRKQISKLENSKNVFSICLTDKEFGYISIDVETENVLVHIPQKASVSQRRTFVGHEMQHAYQFENGKLSLLPDTKTISPSLYDFNDEIEAYTVMNIVQSGALYFTSPNSPSDIETPLINGDKKSFNWRWTQDDMIQIGGLENLTKENLRIANNKAKIINELKKKGEYFNRYKFKSE